MNGSKRRGRAAYLRRERQFAYTTLSGLVASLCFSSGYAQETPRAGAGSSAIEEVTVTGSRIRGVAPVGSPTIGLERDQFTASTATTVADILKEVPQIISIGIDETSFGTVGVAASNLSRASAINLRGLGPSSTLVLVNGRRVTQSGTAGAFVDSSVIPTIAIERLEVVADGASAIYGSDAVAGVVNLILREDFTGAETSLRFNGADGYQKTQFSQLLGKSWDRGNVMFAYDYAENDALNSLERSFFRQDQRPRGGSDYRQSTCNPGNIIVGGVSYAIPQSSNPTPNPADLVPNTRNLCDNAITDIIPEQKRHSGVFFVNQDVTDSFRISAEGFYSRKDLEPRFAAQGSVTTQAVFTVPASNAYFVLPEGVAAESVNVEYSFLDQVGLLSADGFSEVYSFTVAGELDIGSDWRLEIAASAGRNRDYTFSRTIFNPALNAALASSDPNTALNPFGPGTNPQVIENIFVGQFSPGGTNRMKGAELRADGRLFEMKGGTARMAVGAEFRRYTLSTDTTRGSITNPSTDWNYGEREVVSGYIEAFLPIVGSSNARPGVQQLDLSMAVRHDDYSDFGTTTNPKIGVTWRPVDSLAFRSSYGTSFRAPTLADLRPPGEANVSSTLQDPLSPTGVSRGITIRGGNRDLQPEEAETYTFGLDWTPTALPDLNVRLTYFSVEYEKQIGNAFGAQVLMQEDIYKDIIIRNPTEQQIQDVLNNGRPLSGVLPPTIEYIVDARNMNRGTTNARGFDLEVYYDWQTERSGTFSWSAYATYFSKYDTQQTPLAPVMSRVGTIDYPLGFRGRTQLRWRRDRLTVGGYLNYSEGYWDTDQTPWDRIGSYTTIDGFMSVDLGKDANSPLTFSLNVANLFDEDPPFVDSTAGFDAGKASPYGRMVTLMLSKTW